jgi:hypothetical protein
VLQRPVSILYGAVPVALAFATLRRQWGPLLLALGALGLGTFVCGILPQSLLYKYLYGAYLITSPGRYRFFMQYGHAHPWLLLFAPHGGLFYTAPAVWIAVPGLLLALLDRRLRVLAAGLLFACATATWVSGAAIDWHGSGAFGARRLTSVLPLLAVPTAMSLERARRWLRAKPSRAVTALGVAVLVPIGFTIVGAAFALGEGHVPTDSPSSQAGLYGQGALASWQFLDEKFGDVSILPAELVFRLRYGLALNAFRDASEPLYQRNILTLGWERHDIDFTNGLHSNLATGFRGSAEGIHLVARRGTVVFAAQWPYATEIDIKVRAAHPVHATVARALMFGRTEAWGEFSAEPGVQTRKVAIPKGSFDSGILAIAIVCDDPSADLTIAGIRIDDTTAYPPL